VLKLINKLVLKKNLDVGLDKFTPFSCFLLTTIFNIHSIALVRIITICFLFHTYYVSPVHVT